MRVREITREDFRSGGRHRHSTVNHDERGNGKNGGQRTLEIAQNMNLPIRTRKSSVGNDVKRRSFNENFNRHLVLLENYEDEISPTKCVNIHKTCFKCRVVTKRNGKHSGQIFVRKVVPSIVSEPDLADDI